MKPLTFASLLLALAHAPVNAAPGTLPLTVNGMQVRATVSDLHRQRFAGVIRQQQDFSCGAAALATLISIHYEDPVSEQEILDRVLQGARAEDIRRNGLSMLDMKQFLEARGYRADGYRIAPEVLLGQASVPAIALLEVDGYRHFIVIKGLRDGMLLVGDPARGLQLLSLAQFRRDGGGALLIIKSHADKGRRHFNEALTWHQTPGAPLSSDVVRSRLEARPADLPLHSPF